MLQGTWVINAEMSLLRQLLSPLNSIASVYRTRGKLTPIFHRFGEKLSQLSTWICVLIQWILTKSIFPFVSIHRCKRFQGGRSCTRKDLFAFLLLRSPEALFRYGLFFRSVKAFPTLSPDLHATHLKNRRFVTWRAPQHIWNKNYFQPLKLIQCWDQCSSTWPAVIRSNNTDRNGRTCKHYVCITCNQHTDHWKDECLENLLFWVLT